MAVKEKAIAKRLVASWKYALTMTKSTFSARFDHALTAFFHNDASVVERSATEASPLREKDAPFSFRYRIQYPIQISQAPKAQSQYSEDFRNMPSREE